MSVEPCDEATMTVPGKEECPGHFIWSAFGASYPDTACAIGASVEWDDPTYNPGAVLCDLDDDWSTFAGIPCPFHDAEGFGEYLGWKDGSYMLLWESDETPVGSSTEIHFHDGPALWWTATHPTRGEECVLAREIPWDSEGTKA